MGLKGRGLCRLRELASLLFIMESVGIASEIWGVLDVDLMGDV